MKFTIIKSCLARFSGIFAVGTPSNIHGTAISYRCAKFGAFVNSVTILTLRDLTNNQPSNNGAVFLRFRTLWGRGGDILTAWGPPGKCLKNQHGVPSRKLHLLYKERRD